MSGVNGQGRDAVGGGRDVRVQVVRLRQPESWVMRARMTRCRARGMAEAGNHANF